MAFVRRRGRRTYQFGASWDEKVAEIGTPDAWWKFEDAATEWVSSGTDTSVGPVDTFDAEGVMFLPANKSISTNNVVASDSAMAVTHNGGNAQAKTQAIASKHGINYINDGAMSATGSLVMLCRTPWNSNMGTIEPCIFSSGTNPGYLSMGFFFANGTSQLRLRVRKASGNFYDRYWTLGSMNTRIDDGNYHCIGLVMNAGTFTLYVDGVDEGAPENTTTGGTGTAADWFDTIDGLKATQFGGPAWSNIAGNQCGDWDECLYYDGTALSATNLTDLWNTVSTAAVDASFKKGWLYALNVIDAQAPEGYWSADWNSATYVVDHGSDRGTYTIAPTGAYDGTPNEPAVDAHSGSHYAQHYQTVATSSSAGEGSSSIRVEGADWLDLTSGSIIVHYQNTTDNTWNQYHFSVNDRDDVFTDAGEFYAGELNDGTFRIKQYDGTGAVLAEYQYDFTTDALFDLNDGTYYQLIMDQPADGNGWRLWINGTKIDYNDTDVTQDATTPDFYFSRIAAAHVSSGTSASVALNHLESATGVGRLCIEGYIGPLAFTGVSGLSQAQADSIYEWVSDTN